MVIFFFVCLAFIVSKANASNILKILQSFLSSSMRRNIIAYLNKIPGFKQHLMIVFFMIYVMFSIRNVCLSSLKCHLLLILSMFLRHRYAQPLLWFCLIHFPLLSQQTLFLVSNIFIIIALFLLVYVRFYTKNDGWFIYYIAQYKHCFTCSLDYLYICESLKIAWLVNQTKFSST